MMTYVLLGISIGLEICATYALSQSDGFTNIPISILSMSLYFVCFFVFSKTLQHINLGVAYATWSGVGLVATTIIGWFLLNQKINLIGFISMVFIIVGCITLNLFGTK